MSMRKILLSNINKEEKLAAEDMKSQDSAKAKLVFKELQELYQRNMKQLKQKARLKWHLEGDSNSKFFIK